MEDILVLRSEKGSALTHEEMDNNFINLSNNMSSKKLLTKEVLRSDINDLGYIDLFKITNLNFNSTICFDIIEFDEEFNSVSNKVIKHENLRIETMEGGAEMNSTTSGLSYDLESSPTGLKGFYDEDNNIFYIRHYGLYYDKYFFELSYYGNPPVSVCV